MPASRARRTRRALPLALGGLLLSLLLSSCSLVEDLTGSDDEAQPTATATSAATGEFYDSQFTRDGTFQSHITVGDNLDFVYTLYPTKSTPRTNEWYPRGSKFFSFTFQAYDLARDLRDPYETKRKVWLGRMQVTSTTKRSDGGAAETPYTLDAQAQTVTLDPEPVTYGDYGMLVTSPKGAFELRNQEIVATDLATIGVELTFSATVNIETSAGSNRYVQETITQVVPIAIFASDEETQAQEIPVNAN
ncbi:hypothetical protein INN71_05940 [Nocardioides sp. ChNu-153]|uniref:hypothetical protein n=1 Tax=unclassified Nocardioides TaxID=2615069 RepID=UPI0024055F2D|nr:MULTISPECIES: hypothetical protein [unclassified Nocardioides]MDF9716586.1 hypothetical protein [Nocardioides sp. ChNu-99]MDN7120927.1 hypothetical protein [Nocardioides sp. ChNu-153]